MERGKIKIENNAVVMTTAKGTVWLSQYQIADLFGVFTGKVNSNIRSILKSGALDKEKVQFNLNQTDWKIVPLYNLEMITALAFRIVSPQADIFRKWLLDRSSTGKMVFYNLPGTNIILN